MSLKKIQAEIIGPMEAARILGYNNSQCIGKLVKAGYLSPVFTPLSKQRRYRRSDVLGLISQEAPESPLYNRD